MKKVKAVHDRMAEQLWDSVHEEANGRMERMGTQTIQTVYLEAVEETKNEATEFGKAGHPGILRQNGSQQPKSYWFMAETTTVKRAISNERLTRSGYFDLSEAYERIQSACIGRAVYRTVRTVR